MPVSDPFILLSAAVLAPLLFIPIVLVAERRQRSATAWLALPGPLLSLALLLKAGALSHWGAQPLLAARPWVPALGLDLAWRLDGLSLFYAVVVTAMGALVLLYSRWYMDEHARSHGRFYAFLLLFMSAMLGTVLADELFLLFCSWELTGVASFLLIGFFAGSSKASAYGARRALLITLSTGLGLLAALLLLKSGLGPTRFSELLLQSEALRADPRAQVLLLLFLLAAFGKSAQVPFHFWLPGAMEAPTPVSAYLHSATMVKLGVFLTGRLYPLFHGLPGWSDALCGIGGLSLLVGALGAYRRDDIKAVLAYSTIAQLGALLLWYGAAGPAGIPNPEALALVLVAGHVLYKGALFMVAGIATHVAQTRDLRQLRGLRAAAPWAAAAAVLAGASQMGLPGTLGFAGKELLLEAGLRLAQRGNLEGWALLALILASAALLGAVALRLALQPFQGQADPQQRKHWHHAPFGFQAIPLALGLAGIVFACWPGLAGAVLGRLGGANLELHALPRPGLPLAISICVWGAAYMLHRLRQRGGGAAKEGAELGALFDEGLQALVRASGRITSLIRMDRPADYLGIIIAAVTLILGGYLALRLPGLPQGAWAPLNGLEGLVLLLMAGAALGVVLANKWTTALISLSTAGFLVCFFFMLQRAPDLALTQMLIESATLIFMLLLLGRFPAAAEASDEADKGFSPHKAVAALLSLGLAVTVFFLILHMTARPHPRLMGAHFIAQTGPLAHGANAVNTVLVDFRGFDTMFEITVLCIAALGCIGLLMRPRARKEGRP